MSPIQSRDAGVESKTRRRVLLAGTAGLAALAGCGNPFSENSGPQERSFDVTISTSDGSLDASVAGAGDVDDVVQVFVGDTVALSFTNTTDERVGVHDHASDAEVVVAPDGTKPIEYEVTESMTGRQEIEAWVAHEGDDGGGGHGADATSIMVVEVRPQGG